MPPSRRWLSCGVLWRGKRGYGLCPPLMLIEDVSDHNEKQLSLAGHFLRQAVNRFCTALFCSLKDCGMKIETMADILILNSNLFVLYMNLTWLQCSMMYIASLVVIRSGSHTMQRDYHSKLRYLPWSQIINHNHIETFTIFSNNPHCYNYVIYIPNTIK